MPCQQVHEQSRDHQRCKCYQHIHYMGYFTKQSAHALSTHNTTPCMSAGALFTHTHTHTQCKELLKRIQQSRQLQAIPLKVAHLITIKAWTWWSMLLSGLESRKGCIELLGWRWWLPLLRKLLGWWILPLRRRLLVWWPWQPSLISWPLLLIILVSQVSLYFLYPFFLFITYTPPPSFQHVYSPPVPPGHVRYANVLLPLSDSVHTFLELLDCLLHYLLIGV